MTTLYLVRHGETVDNARQIMQGQTQGELNENGVRQAEEVSREWASKPLDAIIARRLRENISATDGQVARAMLTCAPLTTGVRY